MLTDDLINLAKAYKGKSMEDVKKIYHYIERQSDEDKKKIISTLKQNKFNPLIVDIFLAYDGSAQEKNDFAYQVTNFEHLGVDKNVFLPKLVYDKNIKTIDKTQLLLILKNEEDSDVAMQIYNQGYFSSASDEQKEMVSFKHAIEIYKKVITSSPRLFYNSLKIKSVYKDIPLSLIENVFDQAINEYGSLTKEQIDKIDKFLCDDTIRNFRSDDDIKKMATVYIKSHLRNTVSKLMHTDLLQESIDDHLEIINLYNQSNYNEDFLDLIYDTKCCLERLTVTAYINLLNEVIASNYNKDTISIFKSQVKQVDWENACVDLNWDHQTKILLRNSYQGEFKAQIDEIQNVDNFIEYLSQIKEEDGNCDLKPNTMVKKFNEVKVQRED